MPGGKQFVEELQVGPTDLTFDPGRVLYVSNSVTPALDSPNGNVEAPFATIQAALDAAGVPASGDALGQLLMYTIIVAVGSYDEALTIPAYRSVELVLLGNTFIGAPGSTLKSLTIAITGANPNPAITGTRVTVRASSIGSQSGAALESIIASSTVNHDLFLTIEGVTCQGIVGPGIDATGFTGGGSCEFRARCSRISSSDTGDTGVPCIAGPDDSGNLTRNALAIDQLVESRLESLGATTPVALEASSYAHITNVQINGAATFTGDVDGTGAFSSSGSQPVGWFDCDFNGEDWTGTAASDFLLDATSNFLFKNSGSTVQAPSTKRILFDSVA